MHIYTYTYTYTVKYKYEGKCKLVVITSIIVGRLHILPLPVSSTNNLQHFPGEKYRRQVNCRWWWHCWALVLAGWGLWHSFLCERHRIPERVALETHPTGLAGLPQGQHTVQKRYIQKKKNMRNIICCISLHTKS